MSYYLYHFTDYRNLKSIRRHGLMSWPRLHKKKIPHYPASNKLSRDLDRQKGLQDYVRLCKSPDHPMAYIAKKEGRISNYAWLRIDLSAVQLALTKYSNENATKNGAVVNANLSTFLESQDRQAEVLVFKKLPSNLIIFP